MATKLLNAFESMLKVVGPYTKTAGEVVEDIGIKIVGTSKAELLARKSPIRPGPPSEILTKENSFIAPTASIFNGSVTLGQDSSIWYNAKVDASGGVTIGDESSIQDGAQIVSTGPENLTAIGNNVIIGPNAVVNGGVRLLDRCVIGAGATISQGVIIESDAVIGEGTVIPENVTIKSKELWAGAPAACVRILDAAEADEIVTSSKFISHLAKQHKKETDKDPITVDKERLEYLDREYDPMVLFEKLQGEWAPFIHAETERESNPERRGLLYNKKYFKD